MPPSQPYNTKNRHPLRSLLADKAQPITFRFVRSHRIIIIDDDRYFEQSVRYDLGKLHETLADNFYNTKKTAGVYTRLLCKMSINWEI